jgi:eukaryotic-like serine/threonine-protein kinase
VWTPDGRRIVFQGGVGPKLGMFWQPSDGSGGAESLTASDHQHVDGSWSPDGQRLAFVEVTPTSGRDISVLNLSDRKSQPFLHMDFNETAPQFSPDGRWLAYASDESGRFEIYVQPYPGPGGKWQISTDGGTEPLWARNGEIFYRNGDKMMAVKTTMQPAFAPGNPTMLFEGRYVPTLQTMANYDVTPDGQRLLMVKENDQAAATTQINVVLNWFEDLKRLAPTKVQ